MAKFYKFHHHTKIKFIENYYHGEYMCHVHEEGCVSINLTRILLIKLSKGNENNSNKMKVNT